MPQGIGYGPFSPGNSPVDAFSLLSPEGGPEMFAEKMAQMGIGPPGTALSQQDVGSALTGLAPQQQAGAQQGAAQQQGPSNPLEGVQAPEQPATQRLSTPSAPRPSGRIQGGGLEALLASIRPQVQPVASGMQLPQTLGAALGGRG